MIINYKLLRLVFLCILITSLSAKAISQQHEKEQIYIPVEDSLVLNKLDQWQDMKFGLLMHWGPYSQWGIVESWSICPEEYGWCERKAGNNPDDYYSYVKEYEGLKNTFNPVDFNPDKWAEAASKAGMKYVIFTTKHHDGFCMFDSKYTDYKITDENCPFSDNPRSNIALEIFEAFRAKGFWTGAYFSKPDWHSPYYWDPYYPPRDRNVNYDPEENPEKWSHFVDFTHNQIMELLTEYGDMDILWLDGGWVAKHSKDQITDWYDDLLSGSTTGYVKNRIVDQDILMDSLVIKARGKQPGLIVVDRAVEGKNQNYLTPENRIPDEPLPFPWESCIISGGGWSHTRGATYMNGRQGITTLLEIVSKGGNLLLNIAPTPEGRWQKGAYDLLNEFAGWMDINKEAIYGSETMYPYSKDNTYYLKGENCIYCVYMLPENENKLPEKVLIKDIAIDKSDMISMLGYTQILDFNITREGVMVSIPSDLENNPPSKHAVTLKIETKK